MQHAHAVICEDEPEAGFTLIELMIVVLIIAILIAVLIPTFVGAKQRAQDRAMQSGLHNALTAAKVVYSDHGDYTEASVAGLTAAEPGLTLAMTVSTSACLKRICSTFWAYLSASVNLASARSERLFAIKASPHISNGSAKCGPF